MSTLASELAPSPPGDIDGGSVAALIRARATTLGDKPYLEHAPTRWEPAARTGVPAATGHGHTSGGAVLASSGTTGVPKVIPLHQAQLLHTAHSVAQHHQLPSEDRHFNSLQL